MSDDTLLERLLQEQAAVALLHMMMDWPIYGPVLDRYEREIAALRARIAAVKAGSAMTAKPTAFFHF